MINENADLPDDVFAKLPGFSAVLNHAVSVDGVRWKRELTARGLPLVQGKLADQGRTTVTRKEVFDLGEQVPTVANAFQLFYYSFAWGLGNRAGRRDFTSGWTDCPPTRKRRDSVSYQPGLWFRMGHLSGMPMGP